MIRKVTWKQLRRMAEAAHGLQSKRAGIRFDGTNIVVEEWNSANAGLYDFEVDPLYQAPKSMRLQVLLPGVKIEGKPLPHDDIFELADAVFWTMSAIEKFLLPYYASHLALEDMMSRLRNRFASEHVLAYVHLPNSEVIDTTDPGNAFLRSVFAVVPDGDPNSGAKLLKAVL